MFSGHTMLLVIMALMWTSHGFNKTYSILLRVLSIFTAWFGVGVGIWAILANRSHYSVDVIVAVYVIVGLWYTYTYFWIKEIENKGRLRYICHCHDTVDGGDNNEFS